MSDFCETTESIIQLAETAERQGRWGAVLALLLEAERRLRAEPPDDDPRRRAILHRALAVASAWLPSADLLRQELADQILAQWPSDGRALVARAVSRSTASGPDGPSEEQLGLAVADLEHAVTEAESAPDLWGSLGGAWKRLIPAGVEGAADRMIAAYRQGTLATRHLPDAYPLLNFLEERAIRDRRGAASFLEDDPDLDGMNLSEALESALKVRADQFERELDGPWPGFDLARGRLYLRAAAEGSDRGSARVRFLVDLGYAAREAIVPPQGPPNRHALTATRRTLERLRDAGVFVGTATLGVALLDNLLVSPLWSEAERDSLARDADRLAERIAEARRAHETALAEIASQLEVTDSTVQSLATMFTEWRAAEDEAAWEAGLPALKKSFRTLDQKIGKHAVEATMSLYGKDGLALALSAVLPGKLADYAAKKVSAWVVSKAG